MKKIDVASMPARGECDYPPPFDQPCRDQSSRRLARDAGLTKIGVNLTVLAPGTWSSQRHWHSHEDEFVWVVEGELTLVSDAGEEVLGAGDCVAFKAGDTDGHHLINRSDRPATILEIGHSDPNDVCTYSDIDMRVGPGSTPYARQDGTPYR